MNHCVVKPVLWGEQKVMGNLGPNSNLAPSCPTMLRTVLLAVLGMLLLSTLSRAQCGFSGNGAFPGIQTVVSQAALDDAVRLVFLPLTNVISLTSWSVTHTACAVCPVDTTGGGDGGRERVSRVSGSSLSLEVPESALTPIISYPLVIIQGTLVGFWKCPNRR